MKNFVLDTNVLIHNPNSIYSFGDNTVVIPIAVIEELDNFKSASDKKGMHVRQVLREIDSLIKKGALKKGAKMKNKGTFRIALQTKGEDTIPNLDENVVDNKILAVAWGLQKAGEEVFFVSKDVNARIKAEALGIKARDYEKEKVVYTSLYKGWKVIEVDKHAIDMFLVERKMELKGYTFLENEFAILTAKDDPTTTAACKYSAIDEALIPIRTDFDVLGVHPLNVEQRFAFDLLLDPKVQLVTLLGQAGSGKTLLAIASALSQVLGSKSVYEKVLVARPIMPMGKDIGYLPGSKNQKLNYWMQPIFDNLDFIIKRAVKSSSTETASSDLTVDNLMSSDLLEIEALTYIRGRSIPNQFLIVDEAQNLTPHEIKTIVSRAGEGTKIVLTGDPEQIDNPYLDANSNGLAYTVERLKAYGIVGHVFLSKSERSELAALAAENL